MYTYKRQSGLAVAVCAPSGAGKSYVTQSVHERFPGFFQEAVVATTRLKRQGLTESNRLFMAEDVFNDAVERKKIVLPHRPFSYEDSPLYGFTSNIVDVDKNIITEVHASIIAPFRKKILPKPTFLLGLLVPNKDLESNLMQRSGGLSDGVTVEQRMEQAVYEKELIIENTERGHVDVLVPYITEKRVETHALILDAIAGFLTRNGYES